MAIYWIQVLLILIMSSAFHPAKNKASKKWFLVLSFLLLTIVSGIRGYSVGADTPVYVWWFKNIGQIPVFNGRFEPGFTMYLKLLHKISKSPTFLLFVSSIVSVGTYSVFAYRYSKKPTISVLLYVLLGAYFSQMNTMRQAIALSITMWAFMFIMDDRRDKESRLRKLIVSGSLILLASTFHTVAILAFMPWVLMIRQGRNDEESELSIRLAVKRTLFLAFIAFISYALVIRIALSILPGYLGYLFGEWNDPNYFAALFKSLISIAFLVVGAVIFSGKKLTYAQRFAVIMLGLNILFQVMSMRMEIWGRVASLFGIYAYLMWIPEFLDEMQRNRWITETAIVGFSCLYMLIVLFFRPEWTLVVPYVLP